MGVSQRMGLPGPVLQHVLARLMAAPGRVTMRRMSLREWVDRLRFSSEELIELAQGMLGTLIIFWAFVLLLWLL